MSNIVLTALRLRIATSMKPADAQKDRGNWPDAINDIFPIEITRFEITRGDLRFVKALDEGRESDAQPPKSSNELPG